MKLEMFRMPKNLNFPCKVVFLRHGTGVVFKMQVLKKKSGEVIKTSIDTRNMDQLQF